MALEKSHFEPDLEKAIAAFRVLRKTPSRVIRDNKKGGVWSLRRARIAQNINKPH
jgi:hypothetical protein